MKIALVLYPINDLGGIINHVENLAFGLRELGHEVSLHILYWQNTFKRGYSDDALIKSPGWVRGAFCAVHQQLGWNAFPWKQKLSYKGPENLKKTKEILSKYDLVIWEVPVPSKSKANIGNFDWTSLYSSCNKNIAVLHDGNLFNIPWIFGIRKFFKGIACVHECSFNLGNNLDVPRSLILNPQDLTGIEELYTYPKRTPGFLSLQVFKSWKHVDDLIRAIPYINPSLKKYVAGGGIEQRYMVSKNKTKEKYFCKTEYDPDLSTYFETSKVRIWERAVVYGMEYLGFISSFKRDLFLGNVRTLVDSSWSKNYNQHGSHFNRVIVDAIRMGAIPIAVNLGMSRDESGEGLIFKPGKNYIMIPYGISPKEYGKIIEYGSFLSDSEFKYFLENNYEILRSFDRRKIAQDFIDLSNKKACGFLNKRFIGKANDSLRKASNDGIKFFKSSKRKKI